MAVEKNIFLEIEYLGTNHFGFQVQAAVGVEVLKILKERNFPEVAAPLKSGDDSCGVAKPVFKQKKLQQHKNEWYNISHYGVLKGK